ncbi:hypothetical protein D3C73_185160 [compost metagenome]
MKLNTGSIALSSHAWDRIQERFPTYGKNKKMAADYVRSLLKSSEYIGIVPSNEGFDSHMYVFNHEIAIHISSMDESTVTTIYKVERDSRKHIDFRCKIEDIYKREFRKTHRLELAKRRRIEFVKAKNEAEIANLKYRKLKTRSQNVRNECDTRIVELQQEIEMMDEDIKSIQAAKRNIAYALASNNF